MTLDKKSVEHTAHLARINLEPKELDKLSDQLKEILQFIDKLKKLNLDNVAPTNHILPINNILRDDVPIESLPVEKALANAPKREGNYFAVPKVIE